jgi:heme/copper-type cytochrome/quinol oxidase subunit 2
MPKTDLQKKLTATPKQSGGANINRFAKQITAFFSTTWGMVILFVVIFYSMTFLVYYFYSPGPEERRMAEIEKNEPPPVVPAANQISSIKVENDLVKSTQQR